MAFTVVGDIASSPYSVLSGMADRVCRVKIAAADVAANAGKIRIHCGYYYSGATIASMYVGHKGAGNYDFDGSQVQVLWGGSAGKAFTAEAWSDWVDYPVDEAKDLIISFAVTTSYLPAGPSSTTRTFVFSATGVTDASATSYTADGGYSQVAFVMGVEGDTVAPVFAPVSAELAQPYAIWHDHLAVGLAQEYLITAPAGWGALAQSWGLRLGRDLVAPWGNAPVITSALYQPLASAGLVIAPLVQRWQDMVQLRSLLTQPWSIPAALQAAVAQPWSIINASVRTALVQAWDLAAKNLLCTELIQPWTLAADSADIAGVGGLLRYGVSITANGQPIRVSALSLEAELSQDVITAELHPETEDEWLLCPIGSPIAIILTTAEGVQTFALVVTAPRIDEQHGSTNYIIEAMSPACLLGAPWADPVSGELVGMASVIAATLVAPSGLILHWQTVDWPILPSTLIASLETPLELVKKLAAAVGAVVQSQPDGSISVVPEYPVSVPAWVDHPADHTLVEILDCLSRASSPDHRPGYNRYMIGDQMSSADQLRLETEDIGPTSKWARGYQVPWIGAFDLSHTGGPWVSIEYLGIETRQLTEVVEFKAGAGQVQYPIYGLVSVAWKQVNLGSITTAEDGNLVATIDGQSLLEITYQTKCKRWLVRDQRNEQLQLVAEL